MRGGEPNVYAGVCASRNATIQTLWSRMQAFLVFNSVAVPIVFGSTQTDAVKELISVVGFFMHMGLTITAVRSIWLLQFWDDALEQLERLDGEAESGIRIPVFSHADFQRNQEWPRLRIYLIPFVFGMVLWLYGIFFNFLNL